MTVLSTLTHHLDPLLSRLNLTGLLADLRAAPPSTLALYAALSATSLLLASLTRLILRNVRLRRALLAQGIPAVPLTSPAHYLIGHIGMLTAAEGPVTVMARNMKQYGNVYMTAGLLGRPTLWVADHVAMKTLMVTRTKKWHRTDEGRAMLAAVTGWKGLLAIEDEEHRIHRKIINPVFNLKHLKNLLPYISSSVDELVTLLSANPSATVDFVHYAQAATLNVIGRTAIAVDFDALNTQRKSHVHAAYEALASDFDTDPLANLRRVIPALAKLPLQSNRRFEENMGVVRNEVRKIMAEFAHASSEAVSQAKAVGSTGKVVEGESLIKKLYAEMRASEAADDELGITPDGMEHELLSFIAAGHDTTSITLTMALYEMGRHSEVRERLYRDLVAAVPKGSQLGADEYDRLVAEVPLLTHVINETLRVHCPVFINGRQATEDGELPLADGRVIRVSKGQRVFMPVQAIQVSPNLWGPTAAEWDPLRWESVTTYEKDLADSMPTDSTMAAAATADRSSKKVLPPLAFMPFAFGKHSCVGREFATLELRVFLYKMVTGFTWESVTKGPVQKRYSITASPKEVKIKFTPRA